MLIVVELLLEILHLTAVEKFNSGSAAGNAICAIDFVLM